MFVHFLVCRAFFFGYMVWVVCLFFLQASKAMQCLSPVRSAPRGGGWGVGERGEGLGRGRDGGGGGGVGLGRHSR